MQWEYDIMSFDEWDESYVQTMLNVKGSQGWELVHVSASLRTYFLKRQTLVPQT